MGHYTEDRISTIVSTWNNSAHFFDGKFLPQGDQRYDQARNLQCPKR